jgi:hypothetical protein
MILWADYPSQLVRYGDSRGAFAQHMLDKLPKTATRRHDIPKPKSITVDNDWFEIVKVADYP